MLNLKKFQYMYMKPKADAQHNLRGRTFYVDDDTLKYHKARILNSAPDCDGLVYWIIESYPKDYENSARAFRPVVFNILGDVIYRVGLDDGYKTEKAARLALDVFLDSFDAIGHTKAALEWYKIQEKQRINECLTEYCGVEHA